MRYSYGIREYEPEPMTAATDLVRKIFLAQEARRQQARQIELDQQADEDRQRQIEAEAEARQARELQIASAIEAMQPGTSRLTLPESRATLWQPAPAAQPAPPAFKGPAPETVDRATPRDQFARVELPPDESQDFDLGLPATPQGMPESIPLAPATTLDAPRPTKTFRLGRFEIPLLNRDQIAAEDRRKKIESGEYMEITPEVEAALAEAPPALRAILTAGTGGLIKRSTLAGALPALVKPAPQPKTIQPVAGGYLRLNPDGSETFVRTAAEGGGGSEGTLIPTTDQTGAIVGFYNNRTGAFQPAQMPAGTRRSGVPAGEMAQRGALESIISDADTLATLAEGDAGAYIGPVAGQWTGVTRGFRDLPPDVNDLFHIADNLADQLLRARSGAQINESEYRRLRELVPNPRDSRAKFDADLRRFRIESRNILSARQGGPVSQTPPPNTGAPDATVDRNSFPGGGPKRGDRKTARNGMRLIFDGVGWVPEGGQ